MSSGCEIKIQDVTKYYARGEERVTALKDVNLDVKPGEFITIMGSSGSGKSTLLNVIAGLDTFDKGKIFIDGVSISEWKDKELTLFRRDKIGFVFQFFNLIPTLTVEENVALPLLMNKTARSKRKEEVSKLLGLIGLEERKKHYPSELSGGQMQRVAIARAIIGKPKLILADEPTGNLDSNTGEQILFLLKSLIEDYGITMLLVTHDPKVASYGDRAISIKDGEVFDFTRGSAYVNY